MENYTVAMKTFCLRIGKADDPVAFIKNQLSRGAITKEQLLRIFADDHNLVDYMHVGQCVDDGLFTVDELAATGIDETFVSMLWDRQQDVLPDVGRIKMEDIPVGTREVYFWGIPTSGKTCAIGTVIRAARMTTVTECMRVERCQGKLYYQKLKQIFDRKDTDYIILPGRTPVDTNFAIKTILVDHQQKEHPVTIVDMAGELFCSLVWRENGSENLVTDKHLTAQKEFEEILCNNRDSNPKTHFFILEYSKNERRDDQDEFSQDTYLEEGLQYLIDNGVLEKSTDEAYVIITKTDLAWNDVPEGMDVNLYLVDFLNKRYPNFFALLKRQCEDKGICGGQLPKPIPFDIGEVCFQHLCRVNVERANRIVEILIAPHEGRKAWWNIF